MTKSSNWESTIKPILVLTNKPTGIKAIRTIDLPYPRDICSPEFVSIKDEITEMIKWW